MSKSIWTYVAGGAVFLLGLFVFINQSTGPKPKEIRVSGAMQALSFMNAQRAYPDETLPAEGYAQAFAQVTEHTAGVSLQSTSGQNTSGNPETPWEAIGPLNIAGRTLAIAVNPVQTKTLYASSATGGLWRSRTAGEGVEAWQYVRTGHPVTSVSAIAIAESDTNVMFIGTGEVYGTAPRRKGVVVRETRGSYGIGILKSNDGGITWEKSLDWSYEQNEGVQMVRINPENANSIWAATTKGLMHSSNGGNDWELKVDIDLATDIKFHPTDTSTIYVSFGNLGNTGVNIQRTQDGGATWTKLTGLPFATGGKTLLWVTEAAPNNLYASIGDYDHGGTFLVRSTDQGENWTTVSTNNYSTYQAWFAHFVAVSPEDANRVYTAGVEFFRSTDAGVNQDKRTLWYLWSYDFPIGGPEGPSNYAHADMHTFAFSPSNPDTFYIGTDGGVFRSPDGGLTFEGINGGMQTAQFYNGTSHSNQTPDFYFGGLQDNTPVANKGAGRWRHTLGGDGTWTAIDPANDSRTLASAQRLGLYRSYTAGVVDDWEKIKPEGCEDAAFVAPFVLAGSNRIYAGCNKIFRSDNFGTTWITTNSGNVLDGNSVLSLAVSNTNADVVYAGTAPTTENGIHAGVFRTANGGTTWSNITANLPDQYPMDIAIDPTDDNRAVVVFSGFQNKHVYITEDAGATWANITRDLPAIPTNAVVIDPLNPQHIYIGNDMGVFVTSNGGATWERFGEGLPDAVIVMDLGITQDGERKLWVASYGNGMYTRQLNFDVANEADQVVYDFGLTPNYPNPFVDQTTIGFTLDTPAEVTVEIYDIAGRRVKAMPVQSYASGNHNVTIYADDLSAGTYLVRFNVSNGENVRQVTQKITVAPN